MRLFRKKNRPLSNSLIVILAVLAILACTKKIDEESQVNDSSLGFSGAERLERVDGGKWRLIWNPITAARRTTFLVYRKAQNKPWDFSQPTEKTTEHFYETEDLRFTPSQCFIVRSVIETGTSREDVNTKELCTNHKAFQFEGIGYITPLNNVGYVLSWTIGDFSQSDLRFEVARRELKSKEWVVLGSTRKNFFLLDKKSAGSSESNKSYCYRVLFDHPSVKDANTKELCLASDIEFEGISSAEFVPPSAGKIAWSVTPQTAPLVKYFNVYRMRSSGEKSLLEKVHANSQEQSYSFQLKQVSLDSDFQFMVKAVSKSNGLEDANTKILSLKNANRRPRLVAFDSTDAECKMLDQLELENKKPGDILGQTVAKELENRCKFSVVTTYRTDEIGRVIPDTIECTAKFTDADPTQKRVRPHFFIKAKLPGTERPIVVRKELVAGFVELDPTTRLGTSTLSYKVDPVVDKRGTDIFCELVVNDTLADSDVYTSKYIPLPDTAPTATGLFISKKAVYINSATGALHYYDDPVGQAGAAGHTCLTPTATGTIPNDSSNDICEDTTVEVLIRQKLIPSELFQAGKEQEYKQYVSFLNYDENPIANDYDVFFNDPNPDGNAATTVRNAERVGYLDPDPEDKAMDMQVRNPYNGKVLGYSCLDGACTVTFKMKQDFNSGWTLADRRPDNSLVKHAEFEYRIRTNVPETEIGLSPSGIPNANIGWSNWATAKIEVTAVDEEPKVSGTRVKGTEDTVQKIVICEDFNDTDPECTQFKEIVNNPNTAAGAMRYKDGFGKGYYDPEQDPPIKVLPRIGINPNKGKWVKPLVGSPNPANYAHWAELAEGDTSDENKDQSLDYYPFKCDRAARKCVGYIKPGLNQNIDTMGALQVDYNLWVEVDTVTNPDPSYFGKTAAERMRKSKYSGTVGLEFAPVNDAPVTANILETTWAEDQAGGYELILLRSNAAPPTTMTASNAVFWEPDGDRARDSSDVEIRYMDGATQKVSYCVLPSEAGTRAAAPYPGALVGAYCRVPLGGVSFVPLVNMGQPGDIWLPASPPVEVSEPITIDWFCDADVGCQARINPPANYNGTLAFDYRLRTTTLKDGMKDIRANDWSDWKSASLTVASVADKPIVASVSMGGVFTFLTLTSTKPTTLQ